MNRNDRYAFCIAMPAPPAGKEDYSLCKAAAGQISVANIVNISGALA